MKLCWRRRYREFSAALQRLFKPNGLGLYHERVSFIGSEMVAANKKREARKSIQQPGWVTLDGGFAARQCVVQDLSSAGAKITVDDASVLTGRLRLAFSRDARTGRNCEVVWRRGKSLGVKFVR
jgi:PilZ domain